MPNNNLTIEHCNNLTINPYTCSTNILRPSQNANLLTDLTVLFGDADIKADNHICSGIKSKGFIVDNNPRTTTFALLLNLSPRS